MQPTNLTPPATAPAAAWARPAVRRARLVVYLSLFMSMAGYGITVPVMPFLARELGASPVGVSLLVSLFALAQFFSGPVWGSLSDRFGRRRILVAGLVGYALSFFLAGLSTSVPALVGSRALGGLLSASIFPSSQALVADVTGPEDRGPAMASLGAWTNLGLLTGPVIGGVLAPLGYSPPLYVAGAVVVVTAVLAATGLPENGIAGERDRAGAAKRDRAPGVERGPERLPRAGSGGYRHPRVGRGWPRAADITRAVKSPIAPYLWLTFALASSVSSLTALLAYFIIDRLGGRSADAGMIFSAQGLAAFLAQSLLVGHLMRRCGERGLALWGVAICVVGFIALGPTAQMVPAVAAAMIVGVGSSLLRPSLTSAVSLLTPLPQGLSLGVQSSFDSLGRVVGPTFGGWVYQVSPSLPFWTAAAVMTASGLLTAIRTRKPACGAPR